MAGKPRVGARYTYDGPAALGESHMPGRRAADADDDAGPLALLKARGDMHPGTEVTVCGYDDDRDLVLVEWADRDGNPRITSVEPAHFADAFTKG